MSVIKLTPEQELAVKRRSSLLVSAAAGSGKTRVLTQRVMSYLTDPEDPADIDEFLIITYTRAAAAELKSRISGELSVLAAREPLNRRLRRQADLCGAAKIGTIHSLCTRLLRENALRLGLPPDFVVGDEDRCYSLKEKALEKVLDAAYERIGQDQGFSSLVAGVGGGRDDSRLIKALFDLHEKMQSHPFPEEWAESQIASMDLPAEDVSQTLWGRELMTSAAQTAAFWAERMEELSLNLASSPDLEPLNAAYGESLAETAQGMRDFLLALDMGWDRARQALPIPFPRLKPLRGFQDEEAKVRITALRDACKKAAARLEATFDAPSEKQLRDLSGTFPAMKSLLELTLEFDRAYAGEKRRFGLADFSDLEHGAVQLLWDRRKQAPTELARELSMGFREILVDEYQDVNAVQDLIFQCLSRDGKNIFMVGDLKQSVYRFRLADPEIFLNRLSGLREADSPFGSSPAKVFLRRNFRSDRKILEACNGVFSRLMSPELGDVAYDGDSALFPPENAPEGRGQARLFLLDLNSEEDAPDRAQAEAGFIARKIRGIVEAGETVMDNGAERPLRWSDFAVLMRSPGSLGAAYSQAFKRAGVPLSPVQGGFFTNPGVSVLISLLSAIDDPHRDVPLAAVLSSPVFGLTADQLARIRAGRPGGPFYEALEACAGLDSKCRRILNLLGQLRDLAQDLSVRELLDVVYDRLELFPLWAAAYGESGTQALMLFAQLAGDFENSGYRGLPAFLSRLEAMELQGREPEAAGASRDCVALMSVHKSKGLEFPVVFLAETSRKFNKKDLSAPVLIHSRLGIGGKVRDQDRGLEYPALAYRAIRDRLDRELLSEEMRVLYVAMTRARERLYITCSVKEPEKALAQLSAGMTDPPDPELLRTQPSMGRWLMAVAAAAPGRGLELELVSRSCPQDEDEAPEEGHVPPPPPEPDELKALREVLEYSYPYEYAASLPAKLTATSLPRTDADQEALDLVPRAKSFDLPSFSRGIAPLTAAQRGVATHTVMQYIDFARQPGGEALEEEIARIASLGHLTPAQAEAVDRDSLLRFLSSPMGERIRRADKVYREFRFSLLCPASRFYPEAGDETLLLQGIVDCCIEENGLLTVVDYKTDRVTQDTMAERAKAYLPQIQAYAYAMERITGKPVKSAALCFLSAGLTVELELQSEKA